MFVREKRVGYLDETMLSVFRDHGVVRKDSRENLNKTAEDRSIYQLVEPGWLVVNRMKAWQGSVGIAFERGTVSGHYLCFRPTHQHDHRFLNHLLRSEPMRVQYESLSRGVRPGQAEIDNEWFKSIRLHLPDLAEQRRIADFLDQQVGQIDAAAAGARDLLTRLEERTMARILRAVGGGTHSPRQATSLPWLPDVPQHWSVVKLSLIARMGSGHTPSRSDPDLWVDAHIPWLTTNDVHRFRRDDIDTINDPALRISQAGLASSSAVLHPAGTVALSRTASAGFSVVMGRDMATSQDFVTWTCSDVLDPYYLLAVLRASRGDLLGRLAMGSTHKTIYFPDLEALRVPLPSLEEQRAIVGSVRTEQKQAREARGELQTLLALLEERKRALITSCVTGAFDVTAAEAILQGVRS
jgi:type I restriction enzyme S subunit